MEFWKALKWLKLPCTFFRRKNGVIATRFSYWPQKAMWGVRLYKCKYHRGICNERESPKRLIVNYRRHLSDVSAYFPWWEALPPSRSGFLTYLQFSKTHFSADDVTEEKTWDWEELDWRGREGEESKGTEWITAISVGNTNISIAGLFESVLTTNYWCRREESDRLCECMARLCKWFEILINFYPHVLRPVGTPSIGKNVHIENSAKILILFTNVTDL